MDVDRFDEREFEKQIGGGGRGGPRVSVHMRTHRAGRDVREDAIRLKNLLTEAEGRLASHGMRPAEARELLAPAGRLLDDNEFWRHQGDGLAIFLDAEGMRRYRVPMELEDVVVVGERFHVSPLLPLLSDSGRFYILALSRNDTRLLEATREWVEEAEVPEGVHLPRSFEEFGKVVNEEKQLQFHTRAPQGEVRPGQGVKRDAVFHGHGGGGGPDRRIFEGLEAEFCRALDHAVNRTVAGEKAPLVLAAAEPLASLYRQINRYPHLAEPGVEGNADHLTDREIHELAWLVARPHLIAERERAVAEYRTAASEGAKVATEELDDVLSAAQEGRVGMLLLAANDHTWGRFDPRSRRVERHEAHEADDEDLLNVAGIMTRRTGGRVFGLRREQMPGCRRIAAVYRY